jgi:hypothetical protein
VTLCVGISTCSDCRSWAQCRTASGIADPRPGLVSLERIACGGSMYVTDDVSR